MIPFDLLREGRASASVARRVYVPRSRLAQVLARTTGAEYFPERPSFPSERDDLTDFRSARFICVHDREGIIRRYFGSESKGAFVIIEGMSVHEFLAVAAA